MSFNNIRDADAAIRIIRDFKDRPTVVALKHMNPCGIGQADDIETAWANSTMPALSETEISARLVIFLPFLKVYILQQIEHLIGKLLLKPFQTEGI